MRGLHGAGHLGGRVRCRCKRRCCCKRVSGHRPKQSVRRDSASPTRVSDVPSSNETRPGNGQGAAQHPSRTRIAPSDVGLARAPQKCPQRRDAQAHRSGTYRPRLSVRKRKIDAAPHELGAGPAGTPAAPAPGRCDVPSARIIWCGPEKSAALGRSLAVDRQIRPLLRVRITVCTVCSSEGSRRISPGSQLSIFASTTR